MEKLPIINPPTGAHAAISSMPLAPICERSSKLTPHQIKAAAATDRLFAWCLMPDAGDPQAYLAGAMQILGDYPEEVMNIISEPRAGTILLKDHPSLRQLREACETVYAPILRDLERRRRREDEARSLPPPRRPHTPEEQARIDRQVARAKFQLRSGPFGHPPPPRRGLLPSITPYPGRWLSR